MPTANDLFLMAISLIDQEKTRAIERSVSVDKQVETTQKSDEHAFRRSVDLANLQPVRPMMPTALFRA